MSMTQTVNWASPIIVPSELSPEISESLEVNCIQPAIAAIEAFAVSRSILRHAMKGCSMNLPVSEIKDGAWPEDWDTVLRFKSHGECESGLLLENVLPYKEERGNGFISATPNNAFNEPGIIVFARSKPFNGHTVTVKRRTDDRIYLEVKIKVPNEDAFRWDWFKIV